LHIDASKLHFIQSEGSYHSTLDQIGFVLDSRGQTVENFSNTLALNLQTKAYEAVLKQGVETKRTLSLKPGLYQVRLFVREVGSNMIGTASDLFDVPDFKADRLCSSSIFLAAQQGETYGAGATPSQRRFKQNGELSYSLVIYNPKTDDRTQLPNLELRARILNSTKVVFAGELRPVTPGEGSALPFKTVIGGVIKPLGLPPGDYSLEVIVWDKLRKKDSIIRRETDFSVE